MQFNPAVKAWSMALSMQERAWLVGGVIHLRSQPGQGASIEASFPLTKPRPDETLPAPNPKL